MQSGGLSASNASPRPSSSNHVSGQPSIKPSSKYELSRNLEVLLLSQINGVFDDPLSVYIFMGTTLV